MTLLIAVAFSAVLSLLGTPFGHWLCWFTWSKVGAVAGLGLYGMFGGLGGALAYAANESIIRPQLGDNQVVRGLLYGLLGALLFRADLRLGTDAASLLATGLQWVASGMDVWTERRARKWLNALDLQTLLQLARQASVEIKDSDLSGAIKTKLQESLVPAMEESRASDTNESAEGRARIENFLVKRIVGDHRAKP